MTQTIPTKYQFADWLCGRANFDTFVTLTLKQARHTEIGTWAKIDRSACENTALLFRDRLSQRMLGTGRRRKGQFLPFAAFVEGDAFTHTHLHLLIETGFKDNELAKFKVLVSGIATRLDWFYRNFDAQFITYGKPEFVANYCLKSGNDAFLEKASFLP